MSRPTYNDGEVATVTVTLTATVSKNSESVTKTFVITVKKISTSATLSSLTVSKGVLQPAFNSSITTYLDAPVPFSDNATPAYNDTQSASITATAANSGATIKINSTSVTSGSAHTINNLSVGANTAEIVVTAEDEVTTATYTVTVYRAIPVFKTGQTTSYVTGDDGDLEKGVSWPATRFTDNGNGTMTDNMTGLVWLKDASYQEALWIDLLNYCENNTTGAIDWRMPNVREIRSLAVIRNNPHSWLITQGFTGVSSSSGGYCYHASTSKADNSAAAFSVSMYGFIEIPGVKNNNCNQYVWPVRGESSVLPITGQIKSFNASGLVITDGTLCDDGKYQKGVKFPSTRFMDNGDGTLTDNMTGLMWLKNANIAGGKITWSNAFTYINGLNSGSNPGNCSYSDWRMPSINEFETLIDYSISAHHSWLSSKGFTGIYAGYYWSNSTSMLNTSYALGLILTDGTTSAFYKVPADAYLWVVRGPVQ